MPSSSQFSLSFKYPTGVARDLWVATSDSWVGVAVGFQRDHLREALSEPTSMPGAKRYLYSTGIYILRGKDPITSSTLVYVGKGSRVGDRLQTHARPDNDWWTEAVAIVSENDKWDSSQAGFFEAQLYDLAIEARRCALKNGNQPQGDELTDHKKAVAENLFEGIIQRLPALGYPEFIVSGVTKTSRKRRVATSRNASAQPSTSLASAATASSPKTRATAASAESAMWDGPPEAEFRLKRKGLVAYARRGPGKKGLTVLRGSQAVAKAKQSCTLPARKKREEIWGQKATDNDGAPLLFHGDQEFRSASMATLVVVGAAAHASKEWKDKSDTPLRNL